MNKIPLANQVNSEKENSVDTGDSAEFTTATESIEIEEKMMILVDDQTTAALT